MRMYQEMGLTGEAEAWLEENCVTEDCEFCPHCHKAVRQRLKVLHAKQEDHFYGDGPALRTFLMKDGRKVREITQTEPWYCGPMHFACLEIEDGTLIGEWLDEEIEEHCR